MKSETEKWERAYTRGKFDEVHAGHEIFPIKNETKTLKSVRNPSQNFPRFWDGIVFLTEFVRNLWENILFKHVIIISHGFGTDLGWKFRSVKTVPNPSEKIRQKRFRPKIPSENTSFLVVDVVIEGTNDESRFQNVVMNNKGMWCVHMLV